MEVACYLNSLPATLVQVRLFMNLLVCRASSDLEANLDLPSRLTLQRYRNEASAAKYEMNAVLKEMKRHKKESERVQLQQQLSIRGLKEQVALAQQALQQQVRSLTMVCLSVCLYICRPLSPSLSQLG